MLDSRVFQQHPYSLHYTSETGMNSAGLADSQFWKRTFCIMHNVLLLWSNRSLPQTNSSCFAKQIKPKRLLWWVSQDQDQKINYRDGIKKSFFRSYIFFAGRFENLFTSSLVAKYAQNCWALVLAQPFERTLWLMKRLFQKCPAKNILDLNTFEEIAF